MGGLILKKISFFGVIFFCLFGCKIKDDSLQKKMSYCDVYVVSPLISYSVMLNLEKLRKIGFSYTYIFKTNENFFLVDLKKNVPLFQNSGGDRFLADCFDEFDIYLGSLTIGRDENSCYFKLNGEKTQKNFFFLVENIPNQLLSLQIKEWACKYK